MFRIVLCSTLLAPALALLACGSGEEAVPAKPAPETPPPAAVQAPQTPADLPNGIVLALAQFNP